MAGREPDPLRRHEIEERIVRTRQRFMNLGDHGLILLRAGDGEHLRVSLANALGLDAEAARHDDAAVRRQSLADRRKRFLLGAVEEAAGVDHDRVGALIARGQLVTFGAKPRDDALGIDQGLGAAEAHKADSGRRRFGRDVVIGALIGERGGSVDRRKVSIEAESG